MAAEIERKFLVAGDDWRGDRQGMRISQGYLCRDPERTTRIRVGGDKAWITIKGISRGISRAEFEYEIPVEDARALLELCLPSVIDKTRYEIPHGNHLWEVDVFHGDNEGLVVAEVELTSEDDSPELPDWVGDEVSTDPRYYNSALAKTPFSHWAMP